VQTVGPQPHDDRVRLPVPARRVIVEARAPETPPIAAQEVGRDATFIEKDVPSRVAEREPVSPPAAFSGDISAPLLVGVDRLPRKFPPCEFYAADTLLTSQPSSVSRLR
jgi:hypothetical protein